MNGIKTIEGEEIKFTYKKNKILELNCDIIGDKFWKENTEILAIGTPKKCKEAHSPSKPVEEKKAKLVL